MTASYTGSETFTVAHARNIGYRVTTDLKRFQRFYGRPSDSMIDAYESEIVELLRHDVMDTVIYGFMRHGRWTEAAIRFHAVRGGHINDDPGRVRPGLDVTNATFTSFLTLNSAWNALTNAQKIAIEAGLPFQRGSGDDPGLEAGYWESDKVYSAGGRGLSRSSVRRW